MRHLYTTLCATLTIALLSSTPLVAQTTVRDTLTAERLGLIYGFDKFNEVRINSSAVYTGRASGEGNVIRLNSTSCIGIISSRGYIRSVKILWDSSSSSSNKMVIKASQDIPFKQNDLQKSTNYKDKLGNSGYITVPSSSSSPKIPEDNAYMAIAATGAIKVHSIIVEWDETFEGAGTLDSPYTINDILKISRTRNWPTIEYDWFTGEIQDVSKDGLILNKLPQITLGVADALWQYLGVESHPENLGRTLLFQSRFSSHHITDVSRYRGLTDSISIQHDEGFGTYYNTVPYEMPEGMEGGVVTDAKDGSLVVDYQYKAGSIVPAGVPLLIKSEATGKFDVSIVAPTASTAKPEKNLLYGAKDVDEKGKTFVAGNDVKYFILSRDRNGQNLGFYYGAENGAPVSYQSPYAFLALPAETSQSIKSFSLDGATTVIEGIPVSGIVPATAIYTITGVKVSGSLDNLPSGIYIVDGKKFIIN